MKNSIKNITTLKAVIAFSILALFASCSKDSSTTLTTSAVAFEHATAKPIFDKYCTSCHASGKSNAKDWLYNAADYNTSIKGYISTIYNDVYTKKSMPQGASLTTAELASFKSWYDSGYPAK